MVKLTPRLLGGIAGAVVALSWVAWLRWSPPPCTGGVFIEFQPPLLQPGPYHFTLALDDAKSRCEFDVPLPVTQSMRTGHCGMRMELRTLGKDAEASIVGLTVGASPKKLQLSIKRGAEALYDQTIVPQYSEEVTSRTDSKRFCGQRATVTAECIPGSSQCLPFAAACDGPEDCPNHQVCCASPEAGRSFGFKLASRCTTASYCISRLAHIACHNDDDCPKDMTCKDESMRGQYKPEIKACSSRGAH